MTAEKEYDVVDLISSDEDDIVCVPPVVETSQEKNTENIPRASIAPVLNQSSSPEKENSSEKRKSNVRFIDTVNRANREKAITAGSDGISTEKNRSAALSNIQTEKNRSAALSNIQTDYFNLEHSESDEEDPIIVSPNVNDLLASASALNDVSCGPDKPCDALVQNVDTCSKKRKDIPPKANKPPQPPDKSHHPPDSEDFFIRDAVFGQLKTEASVEGFYRTDYRISKFLKKSISYVPNSISHIYSNAHDGSITSLEFCIPKYSHLLASTGADGCLKIFDIFCKNVARVLNISSGINAFKWSLNGEMFYWGGYDRKVHVHSAYSGRLITSYHLEKPLYSLACLPNMEDVFLCGTKSSLVAYDLRVDTTLPVRCYITDCEDILDIAFIDNNEFACTSSAVNRESANHTIMVWDFARAILLSKQIYQERYTCPSIKKHPHKPEFVAQSNGGYIAAFSSHSPYKIQDIRYTGHNVQGYGIECDFSPDGRYLASGDSNGEIFIYRHGKDHPLKTLPTKHSVPATKVRWHPVLHSVLVTALWNGEIQVWK